MSDTSPGNPENQGNATQVDAASAPVKLKQPPGLWCLFIVEMWERFSYYGMRAILVLYLVAEWGPGMANPGRSWTDAQASHLYGYYTGLVYLTPILGGLIADRLIGTHRSMVAGSLLIALGHVTLAISGIGEWASNHAGMSIFITGLALIILGTGHFKPCVSVMVGQLYEEHDPRRDGGFTIFYMGINVGAFLAPLVCGFLGESDSFGWHWGFGAAAIGMVLGLFTYLLVRPIYLKGIGDPPEGKANTLPLFILGSIVLSAIIGLMYFFGAFSAFGEAMSGLTKIIPAIYLTLGGIALIIALAIWFIASQEPGEKGQVFTVLCFIIFNAVFWLAFEQAGSSLTLFAERDTDRIIMGHEMPASWFQTINPFLIVALAPLYSIMWGWLGRRNANPTQSLKIVYGLVLLGAGYVFMVFGGIRAAEAKVGIIWLAAAYFLHTTGELCLSPTGLSFVTKASPAKLISFIMGLWFLSSVVANFGGGLVAGTVTLMEAGQIEITSPDGGRLHVLDRVGGNDRSLAVTGAGPNGEQAATSLGILNTEGVNRDSFDGSLIARAGYRDPASTIGQVIEFINNAPGNEGRIVASLTDEGNALVLTDTTGGPSALKLDEPPGSHSVTDLGLPETAADGTLDGEDLFEGMNLRSFALGLKLAELNGGEGVATGAGPDFVITTRDGTAIEVDLDEITNGNGVKSAADTMGGVIDRINDATANEDKITAGIAEDGRSLWLLDKSKGDATLTVGNTATATDLGIAGSADGSSDEVHEGQAVLTEEQVGRLRSYTKLSVLNDGEGVRVRHDEVDFTITARDGVEIEVNLGCVNGISKDTLLTELNNGNGLAIDDDPTTPDIAFIGRDEKSYEVDLTEKTFDDGGSSPRVLTFGDLQRQVSENTGKKNPIWNNWGIRFAGKGDFFFLFVVSAGVAAIVVLILTPIFKRMLHGVE